MEVTWVDDLMWTIGAISLKDQVMEIKIKLKVNVDKDPVDDILNVRVSIYHLLFFHVPNCPRDISWKFARIIIILVYLSYYDHKDYWCGLE